MKDYVEWDYFDKFNSVLDKYMEDYGEGNTMASQIATAINRLVYQWYNNEDVYDNTYYMEGWDEDISSYANWLYKNIPETRKILNRITRIDMLYEYENILKDLADRFLTEDFLKQYSEKEKVGSIYKSKGKFKFKLDHRVKRLCDYLGSNEKENKYDNRQKDNENKTIVINENEEFYYEDSD